MVVIEPELLDVFPDARAVNEALRALAPVLRRRSRLVTGRAKPGKALQVTGPLAR